MHPGCWTLSALLAQQTLQGGGPFLLGQSVAVARWQIDVLLGMVCPCSELQAHFWAFSARDAAQWLSSLSDLWLLMLASLLLV